MGLRRWDGADDTLRAWMLLTNIFSGTLEEEGMNLTPKNIVVLNDGFGAISIPLIAQNSVITLMTQQPQHTQSDKTIRSDITLTRQFEFIRL